MKTGFRQSMAWLHVWAGLVAGWVLFAVFLTGTASYYREEISAWMRPELRPSLVQDAALARGLAHLRAVAPTARTWLIEMPVPRDRVLRLAWSHRAGPGGYTSVQLPLPGQPEPRRTRGGDIFYYFHFDLFLPLDLGRWLVSLAAMTMLVAIITGVVIHRRIFADFFTFRPRKAAQRAWLDAHNLLGVLALPYHLMITYTGLVTFALLLLPWGIDLGYGGDRRPFLAAIYGQDPPAAAVPPPRAAMAPLEPMLAAARQAWDGGAPGRITITEPDAAGARVQVARSETDRLSVAREFLLFDGATGQRLAVREPGGPLERVWGAAYGLHLARFAEPGLRLLFVLSGVLGTGMVATGLLLWAARRRRHVPGFGARLVDVLNVATIAGLPVGMLALFWANRLLPLDLPARALWEARCFLIAWLLMLIHAALRPRGRAWGEQFLLASCLCAALPLVNAWTTDTSLLASLRRGDGVLAGFDMALLVLALPFAALGWRQARQG
ncbi:PepSY-associated TM helix domain-containing protein [Plastoroseomonas hellenica]|uniref:PepSY-associated TM helix domain-containing protein n=1 Tax=Plastoroseomonas hellenica TaxID=2687306 RepID=UPI001BA65A78|nr:PepSY-associated TM helix domain-containing protein [Plastoroseomonas hellenica]MBR0643057.1 PepSY domain-containing protein [Plastoroseomonas hellenica]